MYPNSISTDQSAQEQLKNFLENPEFYLKNLAEYQKMLELLSLNEYLTELLINEDPS
jgi:hypothetical protein